MDSLETPPTPLKQSQSYAIFICRMEDKYQSELLGAVHETVMGLHKIGVIDNDEMMEYDRDCLVQASEPVFVHERSVELEHATA